MNKLSIDVRPQSYHNPVRQAGERQTHLRAMPGGQQESRRTSGEEADARFCENREETEQLCDAYQAFYLANTAYRIAL